MQHVAGKRELWNNKLVNLLSISKRQSKKKIHIKGLFKNRLQMLEIKEPID